MKNKIGKVKMVRCIILFSLMLVIFTGCCNKEEFNWSYDEKTNIVQITNKTDREMLVEVEISVGKMETIRHILLQEFETEKVNLQEYFSKNILEETEEKIAIYEMYMIYPGDLIIFFVALIISSSIGIKLTTKKNNKE